MWGATEGVFHSASSPTNHLLLTVVERRDFRASRQFCLSDAKSATDIVGTDNTGAPPFDGPHHFERETNFLQRTDMPVPSSEGRCWRWETRACSRSPLLC